MKHPLLILFFAILFFSAKAQVPTQTSKAFTIGGDLYIPSYGLYNIGVGASAKLELPLASHLSFDVTGGFTSVFYKSTILYNYQHGGGDLFLPLKAGLKYYFVPTLYIEGEGGDAVELNLDKRNLAAFAIGPGFIIPAGKNALDIGFRYEDWQGQLKMTVLRVAYRIGW